MNTLCDALRKALENAGLLHEDARLLCAVSGGADSVALLHAACFLQKEIPFTVYAIHVQHALRGEASVQDEQFVRDLCDQLHVPLMVENAGLCGTMSDPGMETQARNARRRIFSACMETIGAHALLTAHHRDDQSETVLMHLLRGSGLRGLAGMQACVPFGCGWLIRPFLGISREQILSLRLPHREDASNLEPVTPRNAIRLNILPALEELFPHAGMHIAQTAQSAALDEDYLHAAAAQLYEKALLCDAPLFALNRETLLTAHPALIRRVLRRWVQEGLQLAQKQPEERSLSHADTLALEKLLRTRAGERLNLPCGLAAEAGANHLHLLHPAFPQSSRKPVSILPGQKEYAFPLVNLMQEAARPCSAFPRNAREIILTPDLLAQGVVLRTPLPGDTIHPLGAPGSKPLRRFLTDRKVDAAFRAVLPVLACGKRILWIPSLCTAESLRIHTIPNGSIRLRQTGPAPFLPHQPKE